MRAARKRRGLPTLRRWQVEALAKFEEQEDPDFLAVATPGAGKTTFALMAARRTLIARKAARIVVVVPTAHLKVQWADAAEGFGLRLEPNWHSREVVPQDMHGVVVTYQQAAAAPHAIARVSQRAIGILDEVHHAAESMAWGDAIQHGLSGASRRLSISGTPFRSDDSAIPFIRYAGAEAQPDYEYGYGEALDDHEVVRPVFFPRVNGRMEWRGADGEHYTAQFDDPLGEGSLASQRLRTALSLEGEWLRDVLGRAHTQLEKLRTEDADAGGLVIAMTQDHAHGIARLIKEQFGLDAVVATSDDPESNRRISEFRDSGDPWLIAVRMVSEGVDIPRLRVGVYATTTITDLFFRQAVGRLVRWVQGKGGRQSAYMFIPDDPRIREHALEIKRARRHKLDEAEEVEEAPEETEETEEREQLDLFQAISAQALPGDAVLFDVESVWDAEEDVDAEEGAHAEAVEAEPVDEVPLPELESEESLAEGAVPPMLIEDEPTDGKTARERRKELRDLNKFRAEAISRAMGLGHAKVNHRLNQEVGIRKISEATERELEARLRAADRWLARLQPGAR
ncbi:MAG: DEAD/DEAH box helicase family protein [Myxococcota bacterium]